MKWSYSESRKSLIGIFSSFLCFIHCIVFPSILNLFVFSSFSFAHSFWVDVLVMVVGLGVTISVFLHAQRKHHENKLPIVLVLIGFTFLITGHLFEASFAVLAFLATGGVTIVIAYVLNWRGIALARAGSAGKGRGSSLDRREDTGCPC